MDTDYACLRPWAEVPGLRPPAVRHSPRMHRTANESAPLLPTRTAPQPHRPHSCTTPRALSDAVFGIALSPDMERARVSGGVPRRALRNLRWGNAWMAAPPGHPFFGWLLSQLAPNARHANVMRAARRLALPHDGTRAVDPRARRQRRRRRHHHPPVGHAVQHEGHRGRAAAPVRQRQRARARALRAGRSSTRRPSPPSGRQPGPRTSGGAIVAAAHRNILAPPLHFGAASRRRDPDAEGNGNVAPDCSWQAASRPRLICKGDPDAGM